MTRRIAGVVLGALILTGLGATVASAAAKVIATHKTRDLQITLSSESGQWAPGDNAFVLEFASAKTRQPVDVGTVSLSASMAMPGMAPMVTGATLSADKTPGRYIGKISFPDRGTREVRVRWEGPAGKGSARLSVPVR